MWICEKDSCLLFYTPARFSNKRQYPEFIQNIYTFLIRAQNRLVWHYYNSKEKMCQTLFSISISKWHCLCQQWSEVELFQLKEIVVQWTCWIGQSQRTSFSNKMNCSIVCKKHLPPIASFSNRKNWRLSYLLTENTHVFFWFEKLFPKVYWGLLTERICILSSLDAIHLLPRAQFVFPLC